MPKRRQHDEGSLFRRKRDGRWVARADLGWRDGRRWRPEFTGTTPQEAMRKRQKFLDSRRDGFTPPKGRAPYVDEWMLHWLHNIIRRKVRDTTWHRSYRQKVTDHICAWFEHVPLPDLDEDMIDEWHAHLADDKHLSAKTVTDCHRLLSQALKVAVIRKRIPRNPAANVTPPQPRRTRGRALTAAETERVIKACAVWPRGTRWLLAMNTGMRQGEVLGLTWEHVELENGRVHVVQELVRLPWQHGCADPAACGKHRRPCPAKCPKAARKSGRPHACVTAGDPRLCPPGCIGHARTCPQRHGGGLVLTEPKSEQSVRWIALGPTMTELLRRHWEEQQAARLEAERWAGWEHGVLVFCGPAGRPVDPRADWQDWADLLKMAGLPHHRVHDLRHGTGTDLIEAGHDISVVSEILGHADPAFTRRTYIDVRPVLHERAAETLDARLRGQL